MISYSLFDPIELGRLGHGPTVRIRATLKEEEEENTLQCIICSHTKKENFPLQQHKMQQPLQQAETLLLMQPKMHSSDIL
jgi:hypothetical protein